MGQGTAARKRRNAFRAWKFAMLRRVALPLMLPVVRLWMRTWRMELMPAENWREIGTGDRHVCVAMLHGHIAVAMASLPRKPFGGIFRQVVTLVSPSRDGRIQADIGATFGMQAVEGSSSKRGASGLMAMRRAVNDGHVGAITVDGPRGPRTVPKPGVLQLAAATQSRLYALVAGGSPAIRVRFWDRHLFPLPFAKVRIAMKFVRDYEDADTSEPAEADIEALRQVFVGTLKELAEPVDDL